MRRKIVKHQATSIFLRIVLTLSSFALIALIFIIYQEGSWHQVMTYYKYFFDVKRLRVFIASFGPFSAVAFVIFQALQVIIAPIPGEVTGFVGGFMFGNMWGIILSTIGLTLGSVVAFLITRKFGMRFVEKVVKKHYIEKFNFFITHKGLYITFILFLIPGFPKDSLCYLLGLTHMRWVDFIFMNVVGRLPGTVMLTLQGTAVKNARYREFFILLLVSIIMIFVLYLARDHITKSFSKLVHSLQRKKQDK